MPPRGRRPGDSRTRETILDAARAEFAARGYDATSVRGVARAAGVDPALVHHYYGTKDQLFTAAMRLPVQPAEIVAAALAGGRDEIGERLVRRLLALWESPAQDAVLSVLRSAVTHERAAALLREFFARELLGRIAGELEVPDGQLRASLAASQMLGLAIARYVLRIEPLASAEPEWIVERVAPTIQRYLTA